MTVQDVLQYCKNLPCEGGSDISENYVERFIFTKDLAEWVSALEDLFGPPIKEAGQEVNKEHLMMTVNYGGLQSDQTLYAKSIEGFLMIAMLWPWKDRNQITLKIARFEEGQI